MFLIGKPIAIGKNIITVTRRLDVDLYRVKLEIHSIYQNRDMTQAEVKTLLETPAYNLMKVMLKTGKPSKEEL